MLRSCVNTIFLTAFLLPVVAYSSHSSQWVSPEKGAVFKPQTSAKQSETEEVYLQYIGLKATLLRNDCDKQKALWMGNAIIYTDTSFGEVSYPLIYSGPRVYFGTVSSAAFINSAVQHIAFVIDGYAFLYVPSTNTWIRSQGVDTFVTHVSTVQCCFDKDDVNCKNLCNLVLLYCSGSYLKAQDTFISTDGGYSYSRLPLTPSTKGVLIGVYNMPTVSASLAMVVDANDQFYFRHIFSGDGAPLSEAFPLKDPFYLVEVIQTAGMRGHLIIWSPNMVLYSPNNGIVIVPVFEIGKEDSTLPPFNTTIIGVATADTGVIAIITSDGGLYYGRLGLEASVIKFPKNILSDINDMVVAHFDPYGDLVILKPTMDMLQNTVSFQKSNVSVQQQLTQTETPVISCPVLQFSSEFDGKLFYIDMGGSVRLTVVYVPIPLCPFFPMATLTNADVLVINQKIVTDGVTPTEGYKKFKLELWIQQHLTAAGTFQREILSTVTVDLMGDGGRGVSCNRLNPQKAHVILGCPPSKQIRVRRNLTACTRGIFTQEQLRDHISYTIPKEVYDPELHFRPNMATEDLTVEYSYTDFLCPLLVYHDVPWMPTLELWDGDAFVELVKADFVMFEIHGMHNYQYLRSAKKVNCLSQPQDWVSMLAIDPDPNTAWTRKNYKSCKDYNGPPLTNPNAEYQVLNKESKNRIVFSNYNGMYIFKAIVVDPTYSFCSLSTTFSVYVYGAFPPRFLPSGVLTGIFIAISTVFLWFVYLLRQNNLMKFRQILKT